LFLFDGEAKVSALFAAVIYRFHTAGELFVENICIE
jgi:dipeptide/tripeptide permease